MGSSNKIEDAGMIIITDYCSPGKLTDIYYRDLTKEDCAKLYGDMLGASSDEMHNRDERETFVFVGEEGEAVPERPPMPTHADFSESVTDFQTAMNLLIDAERSFMAIPSADRAIFENDPQKFMEYLANPANKEDAIKRGFIEAPPALIEPQPVPVSIVEKPVDSA